MYLFEVLKALLFGIVEGVTEWLPISSTGHLILLNEFVSLHMSESFYETFEVVIQLGAILAVLVCFFDRLSPFTKNENKRRQTYLLWSKVAVATLPSAILGLLLDDILDKYLFNPYTVAIALILYGVAFAVTERYRQGRSCGVTETEAISFPLALKIGLFQALALVPGTSRSGATILGAMLLGTSRSAAAEFSFFLAIPTMLGACGLKTAKFFIEGNTPSNLELLLLLVGAATAFGVSLITVRFLTDYVKKHSFTCFGIYRIALGALVITYFSFFKA